MAGDFRGRTWTNVQWTREGVQSWISHDFYTDKCGVWLQNSVAFLALVAIKNGKSAHVAIGQ